MDVFGSVKPRKQEVGHGTDSETDADDEGHGHGGDDEDVVWGPDDDAQLPPTSQFSELDDSLSDSFSFFDDATESIDAPTDTDADTLPELLDYPESDNESVTSGMPDLEEPSDSDDSDDEAPPAPPQAPPSPMVNARPRLSHKITGFFQVETAEEKAVRMERETREYTERAEANRLREMDARRLKAARKRADANERMQLFRERERAAKIATGWIPGQKRVSHLLFPPIPG